VLTPNRAINWGIDVVRRFVQLREAAHLLEDLAPQDEQ
jgi:hypothetical protein